jgi:hypothetical protein
MVRAHQTLWPPSQLGARAVEINGIYPGKKEYGRISPLQEPPAYLRV